MKYNKTKRVIKGGGFTGNQLFHLFASQYGLLRKKDGTVVQPSSIKKKDMDKGIPIRADEAMNVIPLDKSNPLLFNLRFQVYLDTDVWRFIVIHEGTTDTLSDWGNNFRNTFITNKNNSMTRTKRFMIAKNGHVELKNYLIRLYNRTDAKNEIEEKLTALILELITNKDTQITEITLEEAVEQLLKQRMSVIGHSQGGVYAYLFGNEGYETVVYNPAPFRGKKPDNTYIVRRDGDIVSILTTRDDPNTHYTQLDKIKDQSDPFYQHYITPLENTYTVFGNKFEYSKDKKLQKIQDRNKLLSIKEIIPKKDQFTETDASDINAEQQKIGKTDFIETTATSVNQENTIIKEENEENLQGGKRKTRRYKRHSMKKRKSVYK